MVMPMVHIRKMGVVMRRMLMPVRMNVPCLRRHRKIVLMAVVLVMLMGMLVPLPFVGMLMAVSLGQVQPHAEHHQAPLASIRRLVTGPPSNGSARSAPKKGATEK